MECKWMMSTWKLKTHKERKKMERERLTAKAPRVSPHFLDYISDFRKSIHEVDGLS